MTKAELIKALEDYNDDDIVVVPIWKDDEIVYVETTCIDDGFKPSNVATLELGEIVSG